MKKNGIPAKNKIKDLIDEQINLRILGRNELLQVDSAFQRREASDQSRYSMPQVQRSGGIGMLKDSFRYQPVCCWLITKSIKSFLFSPSIFYFKIACKKIKRSIGSLRFKVLQMPSKILSR